MKENVTLVIYPNVSEAWRYINNHLKREYPYGTVCKLGNKPLQFIVEDVTYDFISHHTFISQLAGRMFHRYITLYGTKISIEGFKQLEMRVKISKCRTKSQTA